MGDRAEESGKAQLAGLVDFFCQSKKFTRFLFMVFLFPLHKLSTNCPPNSAPNGRQNSLSNLCCEHIKRCKHKDSWCPFFRRDTIRSHISPHFGLQFGPYFGTRFYPFPFHEERLSLCKSEMHPGVLRLPDSSKVGLRPPGENPEETLREILGKILGKTLGKSWGKPWGKS